MVFFLRRRPIHPADRTEAYDSCRAGITMMFHQHDGRVDALHHLRDGKRYEELCAMQHNFRSAKASAFTRIVRTRAKSERPQPQGRQALTAADTDLCLVGRNFRFRQSKFLSSHLGSIMVSSGLRGFDPVLVVLVRVLSRHLEESRRPELEKWSSPW